MSGNNEKEATPHTAAATLDRYIDTWLRKILESSAGYEQVSLIELIRSADLHAYFLKYFTGNGLTPEKWMECKFIIHGIGPILKTFLPVLENHVDDGIPWTPSTVSLAEWADRVLYEAGRLLTLRRLTYAERYGLVRCEIHANDHIVIHVLGRDEESRDRSDREWLVAKALGDNRDYLTHLSSHIKGWARDRIDQYVGVHMDHFIRYDSDWELLDLYQKYVQIFMLESAESDAFPDDVRIGPRTFGEWKLIATTAAARASLHLSFATRLSALNEGRLDQRNLLTNYVRLEDLREVWRQQIGDVSDADLDAIEDIFMLTSKHAEEYFAHNDCPLPYSIRFSKHFALLPQFGYLTNTCTFLVSELKRKYRKDWDRAVNLREAQFQQDLYDLLPADGYIIGRENAKIPGAAGNTATDIDAAMFERSTNCVYLLQLKWLDVFAHNLKERQSRLKNLLTEGNKWIESVSDWVATTSRPEVLRRLDLANIGGEPDSIEIRMIVMTRSLARFSGSHGFDERAAWLSWPGFARMAIENQAYATPLELAWKNAREETTTSSSEEAHHTEYIFSGLRVDVYG